ncbi:MAG: 16S rRNA (uracil(1498)-N(3))-methyltransferase [Fimbriimonadaceae bacterium]|nr:16S rRNA (uracil(1498)-N(3))-methyltransferase [Fimbriimonadaceae bacterium]
MGERPVPPLRSLPRSFVLGLPDPAPDAFELPRDELGKIRNVLRLGNGDQIAVLPGDGRLLRCELQGHDAVVLAVEHPDTEPVRRLTLGLALPKPERLEESIRMATEIGVQEFLVFPTERSVVRWDEAKRENRLKRLRTIVREAAEQCFRTHLPTVAFHSSLRAVLEIKPDAVALSEAEGLPRALEPRDGMTLLIGPEGGWAPREREMLAGREVTLGPRVLRVDTAAATAAALVLLASVDSQA